MGGEKVQLNVRLDPELRDWIDRELALWNRNSKPLDRRLWSTQDVVIHALEHLRALPKVEDRMPAEREKR